MAGFNYMIAHKQVRKEYDRPIAPLYALVYRTRRVSVVVFLLLIGFVLQPIQQAYAADDTITEATAIVAPLEEVVAQTTVPEVLPAEVPVESEIVPEVMADEVLPSLAAEVVPEEVIESLTPSATSTEVVNLSLEVTDEVTSSSSGDEIVDEILPSTEVVVVAFEESTTTVTTTSTTTAIIEEIQNDASSSTVEEGGEQNIITTESATSSSEEVILNTNEQVNTENIAPAYVANENEYTFNKNQCVSVGDGTYHCATGGGVIDDKEDQVFSEKGALGNLEIFIRTSTGVEQITENYYDDLSPEYDIKSQRLVWQRLIEGRYQIVVYDLREKAEVVITSGTSNNMEPTISGDNIVWQQWDGNDWEIVLYNKTGLTEITKNDTQDIGPVIEDNYIIWTAVGSGIQLAQVYSLETGATQAITDYEGGAIKNPRFILVYDTKFDNGDVITRGFDPKTGLSTSLAAAPAPVPIDIPPADSTGETRALIQNKSASREDFSELGDIESADNASTTESIDGENELIVASVLNEVSTSGPLLLTEYDLIVMPYENSATSTQSFDGDTN